MVVLDRWFDDAVERRRTAVGDPRLTPRLDRERDVDERVADLQQPGGVVGQVVERELLEVGGDVLQAGKRRIVERLQFVERAGETFRVSLGFGRQGPFGPGLEIGERLGESAPRWSPRHGDAASGSRFICWYAPT